jgi:hydrogenase/urease accessory protein HupE
VNLVRAAALARRRALYALFIGAAAVAWPHHRAAAHQINLSNARIELQSDRVVRLEVALKGSDADRVAGTKVFDEQSGLVDPGRLAASAAPIAAYVVAHAVVQGADGTPCAPGPVTIDPDKDGVVANFTWSCGEVGGDLVYRSTVLIDIDRAAKQVVLIGSGPDAAQALLDASQTELRLTAPPPSLLEVIRRYVKAGIEHIFLGYDHIAFLVAIVLWARRLWPVIKLVTAFTLAHSITLSLAALQIVVIPSAIVEPAIAASIVYVAIENFFSRNVDKRWRDTFAFGLIHGFGFASALQAFGLPRGAVVPALGAFNIGVEVGQIAIVSLVIPCLIGLDRLIAAARDAPPARKAPLVYTLSAVIAILGCYWILARTVLAA